jgi:type VI secretion system secreted protein VgrG
VSAGEILSIKINTSFGDGAFVIQQAVIEEALSEPYLIDVYASTMLSSFDGDDLIYTKAGIIFEVYGGNDPSAKKEERSYQGIITHMEHVRTIFDEKKQVTHFFHFQIRPLFWMLKHSRYHRIFQEQSAIDIIQTIFRENGLSDFKIQASGGTQAREYCVQYGESHYDFVSRLLEEEGIGYYFVHGDSAHTMVLFDSNSSFVGIAQGSLPFLNIDTEGAFVDHVVAFGKKSQVAAKAYKTIDYNYTTPNTQLLGNSTGAGFGEEIYEYPGLFQQSSVGAKLADQRMEEIEWFTKRVYGKSSCASLAPGTTFTLAEHPITQYNAAYAVSYVKHELIAQPTDEHDTDSFALTYTNSFEGFLKTIPYRPYRKTLKPRIYGSQTAFVTGAGTEVYGDAMARIKVKFHWDLKNPNDETSSLWVRVSQSLSGASWGALYMPRIGMEVVVSFIDGDPDRPLVTGCVYNQAFMPPYSPKDSPHYMTLKSKTFDDDTGSNELRFSDEKGKEEIYLHGQYDMNTVIEHSRTEDIKTGDDSLTLDAGDKLIHQKGDGTMFLTLIDSGNLTTTLKKGNVVIDVNGTVLIKATKAITVTTPDSITINAGKNITMKAGENIVMNAGKSIQKKAGQNIQSTAGKSIQEKAKKIQENASAQIQLKTASMQAKAGTLIQLKSGTAFKANAGAIMEIKSGGMIKAEGAAVGMFKGAITKLGG